MQMHLCAALKDIALECFILSTKYKYIDPIKH